jgi:hypothetical protein
MTANRCSQLLWWPLCQRQNLKFLFSPAPGPMQFAAHEQGGEIVRQAYGWSKRRELFIR